MQLELNDLVRYAFCDPGGSHKTVKNKGLLARSAIMVIGVDPLLNRIFTLDAWAERTTTDKLIEMVIAKYDQWKPKTFGIEANAMQVHLGNAINREAHMRKLKTVVTPVNQSTKVDKEWRIESVLSPIISTGRLFVMDSQVELIAEIRGFPTAQTKDLVDALASAISLVPLRSVKRVKREEEDALARYLRNTGAPVEYINEQIAAVRHQQQTRALKELRGGRS